ncbi:hypothetical protein D320_21438 [Haloferax sp. BAB-2207]|nr:hypothetical protein D320_21438 [Haloferax sp. BAB-2207]
MALRKKMRANDCATTAETPAPTSDSGECSPRRPASEVLAGDDEVAGLDRLGELGSEVLEGVGGELVGVRRDDEARRGYLVGVDVVTEHPRATGFGGVGTAAVRAVGSSRHGSTSANTVSS